MLHVINVTYTTIFIYLIYISVFKISNNNLVQCLDNVLHERQTGFKITKAAWMLCTL